jgi:hypothetical protein
MAHKQPFQLGRKLLRVDGLEDVPGHRFQDVLLSGALVLVLSIRLRHVHEATQRLKLFLHLTNLADLFQQLLREGLFFHK